MLAHSLPTYCTPIWLHPSVGLDWIIVVCISEAGGIFIEGRGCVLLSQAAFILVTFLKSLQGNNAI